jgi:hypothetical protein
LRSLKGKQWECSAAAFAELLPLELASLFLSLISVSQRMQ